MKEIRRENFEESLVDYKGLIIGGRVPKFELLGTPAREFSKTWNLVRIEEICRATGMKIFIQSLLLCILNKFDLFENYLAGVQGSSNLGTRLNMVVFRQ